MYLNNPTLATISVSGAIKVRVCNDANRVSHSRIAQQNKNIGFIDTVDLSDLARLTVTSTIQKTGK